MCMFANGFMGRTFLRKVPNKKMFGNHSTETIAQDITQNPDKKKKIKQKKNPTHGDFSEVLA